MRSLTVTLSVALTIIAFSASSLLAATVPLATPEIDSNTLAAGLGLLASAALIVRSRRK